MPPKYQQADRSMTVTTPLGPDVLLLVGFTGHEAISQPFSFELDLAAHDQTKVIFEKLLGHKVTVNLAVPGGQKRYFSGICTSLTQGMRDIDHTAFQMEIAPHLWLLTLRSRSRIFQNESVPNILKKVLEVPDVVFELEGTFHPRPYCVQYRETDFNFASRLMEEEGISYYFKHTADNHQMVVSNKGAFPELEPRELTLQAVEGSHVQEERISRWQKQQQLRSVKVTLRDHHFQVPRKSLETSEEIQVDVAVGKVTHKLRIGDADSLEVYDSPGEYAHRFDALDRAGTERPEELQELLRDNARTARIRMQQEAAEAIVIKGSSRYRHLASGRTFALKEQVVVPYVGSSSDDGKYVLTTVSHTGRLSGSYRSGAVQEFHYDNSFTCVPAALPYRPRRSTPKPVITSTQTAVVAGPKGEEVYTDKYGRIKVQFHWDREGKHDSDSSCWVRVSQISAGKEWGGIQIPRVGQEVVVAFDEGDPDRPIVVGSVYNADNLPPFKLPEERFKSGIKTSSQKGKPGNYSGLGFDDRHGKEETHLHSEQHMIVSTEKNHVRHTGGHTFDRFHGSHMTVLGGLPGVGSGSGGVVFQSNPPPKDTGSTSKNGGGGGILPPNEPPAQSPNITDPTTGFQANLEYIFGINASMLCGAQLETIAGFKIEVIANPLAFLPDIFPSVKALVPVGSSMGHVELKLGAHTEINIGPKVGVQKGPTNINYTGNYSTLAHVAALTIATVACGGIIAEGVGLNDLSKKATLDAANCSELVVADVAQSAFLMILEAMIAVDYEAADLTNRLNSFSTVFTGGLLPLFPLAQMSLTSQFQTEVGLAVTKAVETVAQLALDDNQQMMIDELNHHFRITQGIDFAQANHVVIEAGGATPDPKNPPTETGSVILITSKGVGPVGSPTGVLCLNGSHSVSVVGGPGGIFLDGATFGSPSGPVWVGSMSQIQLAVGTTPPSAPLPPSPALPGPSLTLDLTQGITLMFGPSSLKISPTGITLTMGPNMISMNPAGITINGQMIMLSGQTTYVKGATLNLLGGTINTLASQDYSVLGGSVMIASLLGTVSVSGVAVNINT